MCAKSKMKKKNLLTNRWNVGHVGRIKSFIRACAPFLQFMSQNNENKREYYECLNIIINTTILPILIWQWCLALRMNKENRFHKFLSIILQIFFLESHFIYLLHSSKNRKKIMNNVPNLKILKRHWCWNHTYIRSKFKHSISL